MNKRLSIPHWLACIAFGMCVDFFYFLCTLLLWHFAYYRKIGQGPALSQWLDALTDVIGDFPLGKGISDGFLRCMLNGLIWGAFGCALYTLWVFKKEKGHLA